jgi:hypothetical protein
MIIIRVVLSVRGASRGVVKRDRSAGRVAGPERWSGGASTMGWRSRADAASAPRASHARVPGGVGIPSGSTTRACRSSRLDGDRRTAGNRRDGAPRRFGHVPGRTGRCREHAAVGAPTRRCAMVRKAIAKTHHLCADRRAPTPRCEATGAKLGLDGAARTIRRGCLIIESESSAEARRSFRYTRVRFTRNTAAAQIAMPAIATASRRSSNSTKAISAVTAGTR